MPIKVVTLRCNSKNLIVMVDILLKRYLWLIDTLRNKGEMTYEELADAWERASSNDEHSTLSKRTLYNHCQAALKHFGIEITCRRGRGLNLYYIANPEELEGNGLNSWLIENFSLSSILAENSDIADKILLEDIPSGRKYLSSVLSALKNGKTLLMSYRNFVGKGFTDKEIEPLCVKLFKRRWYVLVNVPEWNAMRILSLDRVTDLSTTDNSYEYPKDFSPEKFFAPYFGIICLTDDKPEDITLRAYRELPGYLNSLPLHHSQRIVEETPDQTDYILHVAPTFEFIQEILLHRDQLEVLSPQSLRDSVSNLISNMQNLYNNA